MAASCQTRIRAGRNVQTTHFGPRNIVAALRDQYTYERMVGVVLVWSIELLICTDPHAGFTDGEWDSIAILMMRRRMAELKERDAGS